jgi:hypothetical protein
VPPIYQPEVAVRGVVFAADHPSRQQYWVGASTTVTLLAQKFASGLLDRYLARTGYDAQQTSEDAAPDRPDNLMEPADGPGGRDFGAHGIFDDQAHPRSAQESLSQHARLTAVSALATARRWSATGDRPGGAQGDRARLAAAGPAGLRVPGRRERGALIGPDGAIVWLCAPRWDSPAVFAAQIGAAGGYSVTRPIPGTSGGGHYEPGSLIWHSRWAGPAVTEFRRGAGPAR